MEIYIIENWLKKVDKQQPNESWAISLVQQIVPDIHIKKLPTGKPIIINKPLFINWSHNDMYLVIALSEKGHVGVDVESKNIQYDEALYSWVLHPHEKMKLQHGTAFCEVWTRKEAFVKCTGEGIYDEMAQLNSYALPHMYIATTYWQDICITVCSECLDEGIEIGF